MDTFEEWLTTGIVNNWLLGVCLMHDDGSIYTAEEYRECFEDGGDPCIPRYVVPFPVD